MALAVANDELLDGGILEARHTKVTELAPKVKDLDEVRFAGLLEKRISGKTVYWAERHVTLTRQHLVFRKENASDDIKDVIQLNDITHVFRSRDNLGRKNSIVGLGQTTHSSNALDEKERQDKSSKAGRREDDCHVNIVDEVDYNNSLSIHLQKYGRMYHLRASTSEQCEEWIMHITEQIKEAQHLAYKALGISRLQRLRDKMRAIYDSSTSQTIIAVVLVAVFGLNIYDAELQPEDHSEMRKAIDHVDTVITVIFAIELGVQLFVYWFWHFFTDVWCLLDLLVVALSILETIMIELEIGGSVNTNFVRLLRIFRIVKIFSKMKALQRIIIAVSASIGPVCNTLLTFAIINSLYAVLGTKLFAHQLPERFRTFSTTSFTLLQLATWDSWSGDIVRPLLREGASDWAVLFFVSYIIIVSLIIMNVVVAVLLEGFMGALSKHETVERNRRQAFEHHSVAGPMDGLLITLANFSSHSDLTAQIRLLFNLFDVDDSGSLSFEELKAGLEEKLDIEPTIKISDEDFDSFTFGKALCDENGALDVASFEWAMRWQLQVFAQRLVAERMQESVRSNDGDSVVIFAMKLALSELFFLSSPGMPRDPSSQGPRTLPAFLRSATPSAASAGKAPQAAGARATGGIVGAEEGQVERLVAAVEASNTVAVEALHVAKHSRDMLQLLLAAGGSPAAARQSPYAACYSARRELKAATALDAAAASLNVSEVSGEELSHSSEGEVDAAAARAAGDAAKSEKRPEHRHRRSGSGRRSGERRGGGERAGSGGTEGRSQHSSSKKALGAKADVQYLRADSDTGITSPQARPTEQPASLLAPPAELGDRPEDALRESAGSVRESAGSGRANPQQSHAAPREDGKGPQEQAQETRASAIESESETQRPEANGGAGSAAASMAAKLSMRQAQIESFKMPNIPPPSPPTHPDPDGDAAAPSSVPHAPAPLRAAPDDALVFPSPSPRGLPSPDRSPPFSTLRQPSDTTPRSLGARSLSAIRPTGGVPTLVMSTRHEAVVNYFPMASTDSEATTPDFTPRGWT